MRTNFPLSILIILLLNGCGGVTSEQVDTPYIHHNGTGSKTAVRILRVVNRSGDDKYDALCHYLHIKTAQILNDSGRYTVVTDDLLQSMPQVTETATIEPEAEVTVEIQRVHEYHGGTIKFAIFSTQRKRTEVELRVHMIKLHDKTIVDRISTGSSTKGAWGVIASVDRKAMLQGKGFWELDNSMLGIASYKALKEVITE